MLFTSAKISQLALLPQGQIEAATRAQAMVPKWMKRVLVHAQIPVHVKQNVQKAFQSKI
jgi:hypothetical protein